MYIWARQENDLLQMFLENKEQIIRKLSITGSRSVTGHLTLWCIIKYLRSEQ